MYNLADFSKGSGYSKNDLTEEGSPIVLYGQLYTNYKTVIETTNNYVREKEKSVISKGNEVIVPASGESSEDIARASAVTKPGIILGGDLNIIRPNTSVESVFLALVLSNGKAQRQLSKLAQGKSVVHLQNSAIKKVNLLFPEKEEQNRIGEFFKQFDKTIELHEKELEALKETKKAFLQKMFV
ncbi:restriction endonuclease subunit S [Bhargavaea beijingensis]